jgi:crotonobetaine/carnitine-CoA ligase
MQPLEVISRYPAHDYTLAGALAGRLQAGPARPFLLAAGKTWAWDAFARASTRAAHLLLSRGVCRGDRVGIVAGNSDAHVLLLFACARIGAIMVPVNPEYGLAEARYVLEHAGVAAVLCSTGTIDVVTQACAAIAPQPWFALTDGARPDAPRFADLMEAAPAPALPAAVNADDTFVIIYTSGTTGFPKGVMHSQRSFLLAGERHVMRVHLQPDDRLLCVLPMFHMNALFNMLAGVLAAGACMVIAPRFSASGFWRLVADSGATQVNVMAAVSTILARRPRSEFVPGHRVRVVNGSGFTEETWRVFRDEFHVPTLIEGLGMTEIPGAFSVPFEGPHKLGAMGRPGRHPNPAQPWTEARILDDDGRAVGDGVTGELAVKIPTLMQGYYRDPAQTAAAFRDGWFLTGDLVRRDADGDYWFVARKKDIIRRRGENIAGAELDRVIGAHPAVAEVAAIAVPADIGEEEALVAIVPKAGATVTAEDIRAWCAGRLAAHKVPRYVAFVDQLPHTPTHKVAKHVLKADAGLRARAFDGEAPAPCAPA